MSGMPPGRIFDRGGEFMDGIVESAMRGLIGQLKAEFKKELHRMAEEAQAAGGSLQPASAPTGARMLNVPDEADIDTGIESLPLPDSTRAPAGAAGDCWSLPEQPTTKDAENVKRQAGESRGPPKRPSTEGPSRRTSDKIAKDDRVESVDIQRPVADSALVPSEQPSTNRAPRCSAKPRMSEISKPALRPSMSTAEVVKDAEEHFMRLNTEEVDVLDIIRKEKTAKEKAGKRRYTYTYTMKLNDDVEGLSRAKRLAILLVGSRYFDFVMGVVIVLNAVTIGMETNLAVRGKPIPPSLLGIEHTLLVLYTAELAARFYAAGVTESLKSAWVRFDAVLVLAGLLNFMLTVTTMGGDIVTKVMDNANMLKMLRLARLARTVRVFVQFRTLWLLVQGLMYSVLPMLWTCIIMVVVVYIFAIVGMELITNASDDPEYMRLDDNFSSISQSMMTLVQFITLDSVAMIYKPLITERPVLMIYFLTFFLLGPIALMNIVTAIMVESALRTANDDMEAKRAWEATKRKHMAPKLRSLFESLDEDGNGEVDLEEIQGAPEEVKEHIKRVADLEEIEEVFNMLDFDGSGSVSIDEFVDGIMQTQADKPTELIVLMKQGRTIIEKLREQSEQVINFFEQQKEQQQASQRHISNSPAFLKAATTPTTVGFS